MADSMTYFIIVPLVMLKIGIWICCCLARKKRQPQQAVIIVRQDTAIMQPSVRRQGDRSGLVVNEFPTPMAPPQYGFQPEGNAPEYMNRSGLVVNEFPTPMTPPHYGFQAEGNAPEYMHSTAKTQDKHPTTNRFQQDLLQPQFPIHPPPTYEEALYSEHV